MKELRSVQTQKNDSLSHLENILAENELLVRTQKVNFNYLKLLKIFKSK